jgi:hypothetical protein
MAKKPAMKKDKEMMPKDKEMMPKSAGLTAAQKKLPPALQAAMLKKMKKK